MPERGQGDVARRVPVTDREDLIVKFSRAMQHPAIRGAVHHLVIDEVILRIRADGMRIAASEAERNGG